MWSKKVLVGASLLAFITATSVADEKPQQQQQKQQQVPAAQQQVRQKASQQALQQSQEQEKEPKQQGELSPGQVRTLTALELAPRNGIVAPAPNKFHINMTCTTWNPDKPARHHKEIGLFSKTAKVGNKYKTSYQLQLTHTDMEGNALEPKVTFDFVPDRTQPEQDVYSTFYVGTTHAEAWRVNAPKDTAISEHYLGIVQISTFNAKVDAPNWQTRTFLELYLGEKGAKYNTCESVDVSGLGKMLRCSPTEEYRCSRIYYALGE